MKVSELNTRLDFLEWLIMHPGAKEAPMLLPDGWYLWVDIVGERASGHFRHRDGRRMMVDIPYQQRPEGKLAQEALKIIKEFEG